MKRRNLFAIAVLMLFLALLLAPAPVAHAATFTVNDTGDEPDDNWPDGVCHTAGNKCTLRAAIMQANWLPDTDTINFSLSGCPCTITLLSDLTVIIVPLTITGPGASTLTISGGGNYSIFRMEMNASALNISGVKIANGRGSGGGLHVESLGSPNVTLTNVVMDGNVAPTGATGGAISQTEGTLTINNSTFTNNHADQYRGGAIYFSNLATALTINNSTFSNNTVASSGTYESGGAIYFGPINGTLTISGSTFSGNGAQGWYGGAVCLWPDVSGSMTISGSTFSGNYAQGYGGAIHLEFGTLTVTTSTFNNNRVWGYSGGAIMNRAGTLTVANSTFYSNTAGIGLGGGVDTAQGTGAPPTTTIINSTFSGNSAGNGGGALAQAGGTVTVRNTILANSTSGGNCNGTITDGGNNLQFNPNSGCATIPVGDPKLAALADNGGPTQTMALQTGSAAIDTGSNAICAAAPVNNVDQRGIARPFNGTCDIGAFEGAWYLLYYFPLIGK